MDMTLPQTSPLFWNRIAKRYARQAIADEAAYAHKLAKTREYLRPDMRLLEFGCGTGGTALTHAPYVAEVTAIDFAEKMIDVAREKAWNSNASNVTFAVDAIETLPMPERPYDMVLGLSILHLVADVPGVIAKVHDLLPAGGLFVTSTACMADMPYAMRLFYYAGRAVRLFPKVQIFSTGDLRRMMTDAGFDLDYDWAPEGTGKARFLIARKRG